MKPAITRRDFLIASSAAAMEAGKDVYVEKPCSHNLWEGRQLVRAARKHRRMCQHGTQGRSSPAVREAIQKLRHGLIGEVYMARALCFKWRPTGIGTRTSAAVTWATKACTRWTLPAGAWGSGCRPLSITRGVHHERSCTMKSVSLIAIAALALSIPGAASVADEVPYGRGLTDANKERVVIDDMADVSDWSSGTPVETTLSRSEKHPEGAKFSLKFANKVDYTKGEKGYPVGWPRAGKDLAKAKMTDWSAYDYFECSVYAATNLRSVPGRPALPGAPLSVGFYHASPQRSSSFPLKQVKKDAWSKVVIPISELAAPADVQRVQFSISEADYKHGDQVDFYIADVVLTRFVDPAVADLDLRRKLLYSTDSVITAHCKVAGCRSVSETTAVFEVGRDAEPIARTSTKAARNMEIHLSPGRSLEPGFYWARLSLRDRSGKLVDRKEMKFRVIHGPL